MSEQQEQRLSVVLTVDAPLQQTLRENEGQLAIAEAYTIDSTDMAELAAGELRNVKARIERLKELKEGFVAPAKQILENAAALFNPALEALASAEKVLKLGLSNWTAEQKRIAEEARRKAQEEERERRQKAEREAAAARAEAAQKAEEQRRIARAAEEARLQAEREGNAKAAAKAAAEAARASERATAVVENAEAKASELVLAAEASVPAPEAPTKIAGFSTRDNWNAEFELGIDERSVVPMLVDAIASGRKDLVALLKFDAVAANKLAKALKLSMAVPGVRAVNRPIAASSKAA